MYSAFHSGNRCTYTGTIKAAIVKMYNDGNFMLFSEPCNKCGKKIYDEVELTVVDIKPSTNSASMYAEVEVRDLWSSDGSDGAILAKGYVSLRAAALKEAVVTTQYVSYEGKVNTHYETITKTDGTYDL